MLNFCFKDKHAQLVGPNWSLCLSSDWDDQVVPSSNMGHKILHSLGPHILSTTRRLTISGFVYPSLANIEECPVFRTLSSMNDLQTLVLIECKNKLFTSTLNPERHPSQLVLCPNLEKIVIYSTSQCNTKGLVSMARERTLRGAKVSSFMTIGSGTPLPQTEVLELRGHAIHIEHRTDIVPLAWDYLPDENNLLSTLGL